MRRVLNKVQVEETKDDSSWRWMLEIYDEPSEHGSDAMNRRQFEFLQALLERPDLLHCGPARFEKLTVEHNGQCWVAKAHAVARA